MAVHNCCYKVEYPCNCASADDPKNADNGENHILLDYALNDTVDSPNDVESGNAKKHLSPLGKLINGLEKILEEFHINSPYKKFSARDDPLITAIFILQQREKNVNKNFSEGKK